MSTPDTATASRPDDPMTLLRSNTAAAEALWRAVHYAVSGLDTVADQLDEVSIHDDFDDYAGYVDLLHVTVSHLRAAIAAFDQQLVGEFPRQ
jgi:hypothetical protein